MSIETVTVVLGDSVKVVSTGSTGPRGETGVVDYTVIDTKVEEHRLDTTDVHGIGDTGLLETAIAAQAKADNAQALAQAYADVAIAALVGSAPEQLNALNELAAALGNDPNFATTVNNALAARLTEVQGDARYRLLSALLGTPDFANSSVTEAKLSFDPATQGELNDAIAARIAADNMRALLTDKRFNQIVPPVGWSIGSPAVPSTMSVTFNGHLWLLPFILREPITTDQLWFQTTGPGGVGSSANLLVYGDTGGFWPGALLAQASVPTDVTGIALPSIAPTELPAGPIWIGIRSILVGAAFQCVAAFGGPASGMFPNPTAGVGSTYGGGILSIGHTGGAPNPHPSATDIIYYNQHGCPRVMMRRSA